MHLSDFSVGSLGETSIVGSGIPVAAGAALGSKLKGSDRVTLCFFGDGASNQGTFHEGLNLASIWSLPVVFVCENNGYGEYTPVGDVVRVENISLRAAGYEMPGVTVDGQDVLAVLSVAEEAVTRARRGEGPTLIETKTYRFENHGIGGSTENYRDPDELNDWKANRDPVRLFREVLLASGFDASDLDAIEGTVVEELAGALEFARSSPAPAPEAAFADLFAESVTPAY
jgi:pyruvate dehydrogenase E1 component alpha subunit